MAHVEIMFMGDPNSEEQMTLIKNLINEIKTFPGFVMGYHMKTTDGRIVSIHRIIVEEEE